MANSKQYYNKKWLILSNVHTEMTNSSNIHTEMTIPNYYWLRNSSRTKYELVRN